MVGVVRALSGASSPGHTLRGETDDDYSLGSWKDGKFNFYSPQAEAQWREAALHSGVHFQNWSQGRKVDEKTRQLAELGFRPSADIYRGPDGNYYQMTPAAREDPQITALRSAELKRDPSKNDIDTAVQNANARITPQAMALMGQQAPISGVAPANDNQPAANDSAKPVTTAARPPRVPLAGQGEPMTLAQIGQAVDDAVRLGANGATSDYAENVAAAANAIPALFNDKSFSDTYRANLAEEKAKTEAARKRLGLASAAVDFAAGEAPVIGDIAGFGRDIRTFINDPDSRTWKNYGLSAVGLLPFIPSMVKPVKDAKEALEAGEETLKVGKVTGKETKEAEQAADLGRAEASLTHDWKGMLSKAQSRVFSEAEAKQLGGEHKGLIYVHEGPITPAHAHEFQKKTKGVIYDPATNKYTVPALRYKNPNPNGVNYIKFDAAEVSEDGVHLIVKDVKTKLLVGFHPVHQKARNTVERIKEALLQNPGVRVVYEFPNGEEARAARDFLRANDCNECITVVVRAQ
jgi:hypothetical protein